MFCLRNCVILQTCVESCLAPERGKGGGGGGVGGGTSRNSCWACTARFSKFFPYFRPKMSFFTPDFNKMCVTSLRSCVVHGPICGRLMGCTVNGFLSIYKSFTVQPTKWP